MTNKTALTLLLSLSSACGLLKVNGKPLGGGTTTATSEAEPQEKEDHSNESRAEYEARQQRTYDAQEKKAAADKAGQPEICGQYPISSSRDIKLEDFANLDDPKRDWKYSAKDFAEVMCSTRGKNLELRPKVMALRDKWMKQHGLDENDFLVVLVEGMGRGWDNQPYEKFVGPISQIGSSLFELDQLGAKTSMLASFSFVESCLRGVDDGGLLLKILCTSEPLDAAKAHAEIEATPDVNIQTRYHLRRMVHDTGIAQTAARAELAKLVKEEPAVAKLVAIAEAQRKAWSAPSPMRAKGVQLLEKMEAATEANKLSAFAGCEAATHAAWTEVVKAAELPAVAERDAFGSMVDAVFKNPDAYLAYRALELCANGVDARFSARFDMLGSAYTHRGPRTSTIAAWMAATADIKFDSKKLDFGTMLQGIRAGGGSTFSKLKVGTIDSVVAKGSNFEVSFKQDIFEYEDCIASKQTNRILRIESNGTVTYDTVCTKTGMVKYDRKPQNVELSGFVAKGLKPGMLFMLTEDGFPIVATAGVKSKKPVWVFGVAR